jgi:hypothetical protein
MLTKNQSLAYKDDGVVTIGLHPGWVKTDMGGPSATLSAEKSVSDMLKIIDKITIKDSGAYLSYSGEILAY